MHSIFVWTLKDIVGLCVFGLIVIGFLIVLVGYWIEDIQRKIARRKKNKEAGKTSYNSQSPKRGE